MRKSRLFPIGYQALIEKFQIKVIPHYCTSFIDPLAKRKKTLIKNNHTVHLFPQKYLFKDPKNPFQHLLFAVKYEGINLGILKRLFSCLPKKEIERFITNSKNKKETRKIWYFYERLVSPLPNISDSTSGKYYELLDSSQYYTAHPKKIRRHHILDNLLGTVDFCPMIRKTKMLLAFEKKELQKKAQVFFRKYKSQIPSTPVVQIAPEEEKSKRASKDRHKRFEALIKDAEHLTALTKKTLIKLHNKALQPRFAEYDFRKHQNYLAYDGNSKEETICRISPKPQDVPSLMNGLLDSLDKMKKSSVNPVIRAAVISFGFGIIHPFGDGNGRMQLFLLYYLLRHSSFKTTARIFRQFLIKLFYMPGFNNAVAEFDRPLLLLIHYTLHKNETLTVHNNTQDYYRYIDFTPIAEFLFCCIDISLQKS